MNMEHIKPLNGESNGANGAPCSEQSWAMFQVFWEFLFFEFPARTLI